MTLTPNRDAAPHRTGTASGDVTRTAARQGAIGLVGAVTAGAGGLILTVVVGRMLPTHQAGVYFAAVALFTIAATVLQLGADTGLLRALAGHRAAGRPALLRPTLRFALVPVTVASTAVAAALMLAADPLAHRLFGGRGSETADQLAAVLRWTAPFLVVATLSMVLLNGAARGLGSLRTFTLLQQIFLPVSRPALVAVAALLAAGALSRPDDDPRSPAAPGTLAVLAWALPLLVVLALAAREVRRLLRRHATGAVPPQAIPADHGPRAFWRATAPRAVAATFEIVIVWADVVLVTALIGPAKAAVYAGASRFVTSGTFALQAVRLSVAPLLAAAFARGDRAGAESVHRLSIHWAILSTWPVYLALAVFAPGVLAVLGPDFASAATALTILSLAMLAVVATGNANTTLNMAHRSHWAAANTGLATVIMFALDLVLVPRLGIVGAAIGWSAAMLTDALLSSTEVRLGLGLHSADRTALACAVAAVIGFGGPALAVRLIAARLGDLPALVILLVGGLVAAACYAATLAVLRRRLGLDALLGALRRKNPPVPEPRLDTPHRSPLA